MCVLYGACYNPMPCSADTPRILLQVLVTFSEKQVSVKKLDTGAQADLDSLKGLPNPNISENIQTKEIQTMTSWAPICSWWAAIPFPNCLQTELWSGKETGRTQTESRTYEDNKKSCEFSIMAQKRCVERLYIQLKGWHWHGSVFVVPTFTSEPANEIHKK